MCRQKERVCGVQMQLRIDDIGLTPYGRALELQNQLVEQRKSGEIGDTLVLTEHEAVYTLGRSADDKNVVADADELQRMGIDVIHVGRGGDVTYHGPGQIVGYPIIDLSCREEGVVAYVSGVEEVLIGVLADYDIEGRRDPENRGVWIGNEKIAAIGVRVTRSVTMHGFALNVSVDLSHYGGIVPCGIVGKGVTSLDRLVPSVDMAQVKKRIIVRFSEVFGYEEHESGGGAGH